MCKLNINAEKERKKRKKCERKDNELDVVTNGSNPFTIPPILKYPGRVPAATEVKTQKQVRLCSSSDSQCLFAV